jgi:hypothetical protein
MYLRNDLSGVVNANVTGGTLTLNGSAVIIAGTLEATNAGTLQITTTIRNNPNSTATGGLIKPDSNPNSVMLVNGVTIQGGTLNKAIQFQQTVIEWVEDLRIILAEARQIGATWVCD